MEEVVFNKFPKIPRLNRDCVITEKIDGTNAQVYIDEYGKIIAGSRSRWLTVEQDNFGFAAWVKDNEMDIRGLGSGIHYGEWWGAGIQRRYGLSEKRFSLFNTGRWNRDNVPNCCSVVPVLYEGIFSTEVVVRCVDLLRSNGSAAADYDNPEGVIIYHVAANQYFKVLVEDDDKRKGGG